LMSIEPDPGGGSTGSDNPLNLRYRVSGGRYRRRCGPYSAIVRDFSDGPRLPKATVAALDASPALACAVLIASAKRPSVNEEVRQFRSRHPDRPVIPIIVDRQAQTRDTLDPQPLPALAKPTIRPPRPRSRSMPMRL